MTFSKILISMWGGVRPYRSLGVWGRTPSTLIRLSDQTFDGGLIATSGSIVKSLCGSGAEPRRLWATLPLTHADFCLCYPPPTPTFSYYAYYHPPPTPTFSYYAYYHPPPTPIFFITPTLWWADILETKPAESHGLPCFEGSGCQCGQEGGWWHKANRS